MSGYFNLVISGLFITIFNFKSLKYYNRKKIEKLKPWVCRLLCLGFVRWLLTWKAMWDKITLILKSAICSTATEHIPPGQVWSTEKFEKACYFLVRMSNVQEDWCLWQNLSDVGTIKKFYNKMNFPWENPQRII